VSPELVILCHLNYCADYYAQKPTQRAGVPCPPSDQAHLCTAVAKRPIVTRGDEETRVESVWDTGKEHVMMESTFAFDFFTRSRTPTELRRRVETLCLPLDGEGARQAPQEGAREATTRRGCARGGLDEKIADISAEEKKKMRPPPSANPRCE
jgi:hypothetical protein